MLNLGKKFSGIVLFKDICFELLSGEVLAITGLNGSGKSTLLRIIAGLLRPSAGSVELFYQNEQIPKEQRRRFIGMVAPAFSLYDELTAIENIKFFSRVRGIRYQPDNHFLLLDNIGLNGHAHKTCGTFSSGMKQRLKIAQAIVHEPPFLLLDEPGCNLDTNGMNVLGNIIDRQRKIGITIIASNEKREVDFADRVINLSE